jgi:hypothetical protein
VALGVLLAFFSLPLELFVQAGVVAVVPEIQASDVAGPVVGTDRVRFELLLGVGEEILEGGHRQQV